MVALMGRIISRSHWPDDSDPVVAVTLGRCRIGITHGGRLRVWPQKENQEEADEVEENCGQERGADEEGG